MHPLKTSRILWLSIAAVAVPAFSLSIGGAPAGTFPPWVPYLLDAASAALAAATLVVRVQMAPEVQARKKGKL